MENRTDNTFETIICDFCKQKDYTKLFSAKDYYNQIPGLFSIVKCNNCGLVYTNPRPTKEGIHKFYPNDSGYYQPVKPKFPGLKYKLIFQLYREYYNYPGVKNILQKILLLPLKIWLHRDTKMEGFPKFKKNGVLLDIGCSYGGFLYKMKYLGWTVKGIDMNAKAVEFGKKILELDVEEGDIDSFETIQKFDVLTLRMVLEHVFSPEKTLTKAYALLNDSGTLIFSIPNFDGFAAKLYKNYAYTLHLPNHLTHFTPSSIKKYLERVGFKNIKIIHQKSDRDILAPLEYMKRDGKEKMLIQKFLMNKIVRKTLVKFFANLLSLFSKGSRMTIYAEK